MSESLLISFQECSAILGISRAMLYQMHNSGALGPQVHKIGRRSLLRRDEIEAWVLAGLPPRIQWERQVRDKQLRITSFLPQKSSITVDCLSVGEKK